MINSHNRESNKKALRLRVIIFLFFICSPIFIFSQTEDPDPCLTGGENTCTCELSPVLCSINELDGYTYEMTTFLHPNDGPDPMCPGAAGNNTTSHNPTWFTFPAWCTDLTLIVYYTNCVDGPSCFGNNNFGIQAGVYADCSLDPNSAVDGGCGTSVAGCVNNSSRTLNLSGLNIGQNYYFLVDGCCGSACDIEIEVVGECEPFIADFTWGIDGPLEVCQGDTETYLAELIDGANRYSWYLDGAELATNEPMDPNDLDIFWGTVGEFELCLDAWQKPCIDISEDPVPFCITINVYAPDAGTPLASPTPVCPNEIVNLSASGYNDDPEFLQFLVVVNSAGEIVQVTQSDNDTYTFDECADFTLYSVNIVDKDNPPIPTVGTQFSSFDCSTNCCDSSSVPFSFADDEDPEFPDGPDDITYDCISELPAMEDQTWTDNCDGTGMVAGVETGSADICDGGTITRTWTYTDGCDNIGEHVQTITINAAPPIDYEDPTAGLDLSCGDAVTAADLDYTNEGTGDCLISGTVTPVQTGMPDLCGGVINLTWTIPNPCGDDIVISEDITVSEADEAVFIDPSGPITITCDDILTYVPPMLDYTNGLTGTCLISGTVSSTQDGPLDECGNDVVYTWTFTDDCDRTITHMQTVTVEPIEEAAFVNPPADVTIDCDELQTFTPAVLTYTNGGSGACLISGTVDPVGDGTLDICGNSVTYTWEYTDLCDRLITHMQTVTV
jgi:hypothetical protein